MTPFLTSHWNDSQAVGRKCMVCGFAANHCGHTPLAVGVELTWLCGRHAAGWAIDHHVPFPCINGRTAATPRTA